MELLDLINKYWPLILFGMTMIGQLAVYIFMTKSQGQDIKDLKAKLESQEESLKKYTNDKFDMLQAEIKEVADNHDNFEKEISNEIGQIRQQITNLQTTMAKLETDSDWIKNILRDINSKVGKKD